MAMVATVPPTVEPEVLRVNLPGSRIFWFMDSFLMWVPGAKSLLHRWYLRKTIDAFGARWADIEKALAQFANECGAPPQLKQTRLSRLLVAAVGILSGFIFIGGIIFAGNTEEWVSSPYLALGAGVAGLFIGVLWYAMRRGQQMLQPTAAELLAHDQRKPIVLLRSFSQDGPLGADLTIAPTPLSPAGASLDAWLRPYGPLIAIGKPGEKYPTLGAARMYVEHDKWKSVVASMMDEARIIIVILGATKGLDWELQTIMSAGHLDKVLFVFPNWSALSLLPELSAERQRLWQALCDALPNVSILKTMNGSLLGDALIAHISKEGRLTLIEKARQFFDLEIFYPTSYLKGLQLALYATFHRNRSSPTP